MTNTIHIRSFEKRDYEACAKIYQAGMDTEVATFETEVPSWEVWNAKFVKPCRLVAVAEDVVVGWAMLSPFSKRKVYEGVAEVSLYVALKWQGKNIGNQLLKSIVVSADSAGFWTLQAKIFPENIGSLSLFKKHGFKEVGVREKLGKRNGKWHDNVLLERRNNIQ